MAVIYVNKSEVNGYNVNKFERGTVQCLAAEVPTLEAAWNIAESKALKQSPEAIYTTMPDMCRRELFELREIEACHRACWLLR